VVVYYKLLLIVILLCSLLYVYIDIYTLRLCIIDRTRIKILYRKLKHTFCVQIFFLNPSVYEMTWKDMVES